MKRPVQLNMFSSTSLNVVAGIKEAMNVSAKKCGLSRDEILERMNELARRFGVRLVKGNGDLGRDTFEKWLNPKALEYVPTVQALPIFCAVVGDIKALEPLVKPLGAMVIDADDVKLLEWAREYHNARKSRKRMRQIEAEL